MGDEVWGGWGRGGEEEGGGGCGGLDIEGWGGDWSGWRCYLVGEGVRVKAGVREGGSLWSKCKTNRSHTRGIGSSIDEG